MQKSFLFVLAIGTLCGAMLPGSRRAPPAAPSAPAVAAQREPVVTRLERQPNGHFYADATVNGQLVRFLVDTGATGIALTFEDARRVGENFSEENFEVVGSGASGPVRGQVVHLDYIEIGGKRVSDVSGAVIEGLDVSLLGQSYLSRMGSVEMRGEEMIITPPA